MPHVPTPAPADAASTASAPHPALDGSTPPVNPATPDDWEHFRVLREQWTHEDNLVNHRLMWLILSEGLLFTAYGTLSTAKLHWLVFGFPFFGMAVAGVIGVSIFAAIAATDDIQARYEEAGLQRLCALTPSRRIGHRGRWAAQALPFVFGGLWALAMAGAFNGPQS